MTQKCLLIFLFHEYTFIDKKSNIGITLTKKMIINAKFKIGTEKNCFIMFLAKNKCTPIVEQINAGNKNGHNDKMPRKLT